MEIEKEDLLNMMENFWALKNNDDCETQTILFMEKYGFTDEDFVRVGIDQQFAPEPYGRRY